MNNNDPNVRMQQLYSLTEVFEEERLPRIGFFYQKNSLKKAADQMLKSGTTRLSGYVEKSEWTHWPLVTAINFRFTGL